MIKDNYLNINKIVDDKKIMRLFLVVKSYGGVLRFVGGCVRDALMGKKGFDLDLATDLSPDELVEACEEEGVTTKAIGISHGTVGVIINGKMLEVTSLRKDIKTDGRHAVVEYTDDWSVDASRRDLTINAVYADEKGNVFDYFNGMDDLEKGIVRFIGNPDTRIKEDYLRIIRFFRFHGEYAKTPINQKALNACIENKSGLKKISAERLRMELEKILKAEYPEKIMQLIFENGILDAILPHPQEYDTLSRFKSFSSDAMLRLFALYQPDEKLIKNLAIILKLSNKDKDLFYEIAKANVDARVFLNDEELYKSIYLYSKEAVKVKFLLAIAKNKVDENLKDEILEKINNFNIPVFGLKGSDVIKAGVPQGVEVKNTLKMLEEKWVDSNFSLSKEDLLINL
ncbi:MAG: CCA tRNA nucleotidyltransferase [Alphaproteobacteria bacterium]